MLIDKKHPKFKDVVLKDCAGVPLVLIKSYDTDTEEAFIYVLGGNLPKDPPSSSRLVSFVSAENGEPVLLVVKVKLTGAKLYYRETDKEVPKEDL